MANETKQENTLSPTARFAVRGARPSQQEAAHLTTLPFARKRPGAAEVKEAVKWFFGGIAMAILAWFVGNWVIKGFRGPGVLIFGYGLAYLGAPLSLIFALVSLSKLFGSARKKKIKDALNWQWQTALLGDDRVNTRFGKPAYALSTLRRMVPDGVPFDDGKASAYIEGLRKQLSDAADQTTLTAKKTPPGDWNLTSPSITCVITGQTELFPGVQEVEALLTFYDRLSRSVGNQKTETICSAVLEISIVESFVNASGYWFPYELCPVIEAVANQEPQNNEEETP